jgi:hypothetical protein
VPSIYFIRITRSQKRLAFTRMNPDFLADGGADFRFNPFDEAHANAGEPVGWTDEWKAPAARVIAAVRRNADRRQLPC